MKKNLPQLKSRFRFHPSATGAEVVVEIVDELNETTMKVIRANNRWRIVGGYLTTSHCIASNCFDYEEHGLTKEEMYYMGSFVDAIGAVLDKVSELVRESVQIRKSFWFRPNSQLHFVSAEKQIEQNESEETFVYLMSHANGLTKIGFSKNPKAREKTLQAEDPRLEIVLIVPACKETENRLHEIFKSVRKRGEWFELQPHHIDWICFLLKGGRHGTRSRS
jgi:hypothetical protein